MDDDEVFDRAVGRNVRQYRQAAGMTQAAVGDEIGLPQQTVLKIERGERPLRLVEADKLATLFGVDVAALSAPPDGVAVAAAVAATRAASTALVAQAANLGQELIRLAHYAHTEGSSEAADALLSADWGATVNSVILDVITHQVGLDAKPATAQKALQQLVEQGVLDGAEA
ncbi:MAG: helix-turn-helix transcriptional regulator [Mycobacterium sp.]